MKEKTASGLLETAIEKIRDLVDVSTIVGEPVYSADGLTIIPVSRVAYGFGTGGSDFPSKSRSDVFGGGGGAGINITPVAFLVISNGNVTVKAIPSGDSTADRIVGLVPEMFDTVNGLISKVKDDKASKSAEEEI